MLQFYRLLLVAAVLVGSCFAAGLVVEQNSCELGIERLPKRFVPSHYSLEIEPDLLGGHFSGSVTIDLNVDDSQKLICANEEKKKSSKDRLSVCDDDVIVLHADSSLEILRASYVRERKSLAIKLFGKSLVNDQNETKKEELIEVERACFDRKNSLLALKLRKSRVKEETRAKLRIEFSDKIRRDDPNGFFMSKIKDAQGNARQFAVTHFEPVSARKAFPCFDEPDLKATFDVSLKHSDQFKSISNTEELSSEKLGDGKVRRTFKTTPLMSTYLVGFAVGEFDSIENSILDDTLKIRVFTAAAARRSEKSPAPIRFVLDTASRAFVYLSDYFNVKQPLEKLDFIPVDPFNVGGMENWGLVTLKQNFAVPSDMGNHNDLLTSARTVAHEVVHQWFGNLVTMKWWDNLWLKEGFAEWLAGKTVEKLFPAYNFHIYTLLDSQIDALEADSADDTHSIVNENLKSAEEIEKTFDVITYKKSTAIINMVSEYVGSENFREALRSYIGSNLYKNTEPNQLWQAIEKKSGGFLIGQMMKTWISQRGFPLLSLRLSRGKSDGRFVLEIEQSVCQSKSSFRRASENWVVPVTMIVGDSTSGKQSSFKFVSPLEKDEIKLPSWFDGANKAHWIKFNVNAQGFYRVQYADQVDETLPTLLDRLQVPIESKTLAPVDRLNFLDDAFALVLLGHVRLADLERIISWYKNELDGGVLVALVRTITILEERAKRIKKEKLHEMLIKQFEHFNKFEVAQNEEPLVTRAREAILHSLIIGGYEPAIEEALELFRENKFDQPSFLLSPVLAAVMEAGQRGEKKQVEHYVHRVLPDSDTKTKLKILLKVKQFFA